MKILFIYEELFPPFDEGMKNFSYMIHNELKKDHESWIIRDFRHLPAFLNSLLIVPRIIIRAIFIIPDKIIYIPKQSLTFFSLIKLWLLGQVFRHKITGIGLQKRCLKSWQKTLVSNLKFPAIFVLSKAIIEDLEKIGIGAQTIMAGIDIDKFRPAHETAELKTRYGIPASKKVLLHVGHIRESRNIEWLARIQKSMPEIQVLLVGSTTTSQEEVIYNNLENAGVIVISKALPRIEEVYQLSDWYCFPVTRTDAAMEIPLSVLEGMSTNLPVLTTRFGRLPELLDESPCFHFVDDWKDIVSSIREGFGNDCRNRDLAKEYSWESTARRLIGTS